jgi:hypothetical protein
LTRASASCFRISLCGLLVAPALALPSPAVADANLLFNPDFSTLLMDTGWPSGSSFIAVAWEARDRSDASDSGSLLVTNSRSSASGSGGNGAEQCVPVDEGLSYDLGAWISIPDGQESTGFGNVTVFWYDDVDCTGEASFAAGTDFIMADEAWQLSANVTPPAPPGTRSAVLIAFVNKQEAGGSFQARFDDVFFAPEPSPALLAGAALATLAWLQRTRRRYR